MYSEEKNKKNRHLKKTIDIFPPVKKQLKEIKKEEIISIKKQKEFSSLPSIKQIKKSKKTILFLISFFIGIPLIISAYYLVMVVLPRAEIKIISQKEILDFEGVVTADRNLAIINYEQAIIPANFFIFRETHEREFEATGKGDDGRKAKGIITIYNNFSTLPQILVANTRFLSPDNKIFRLDSRVAIPGATMKDNQLVPSTIDVEVTADQVGPDYNIPPCTIPCKFVIPGFEGTPKYEGFYGISSKPMSGGTLGKVLVVTHSDIKNAERIVGDEIFEKKLSDKILEMKIPKELKILNEAKSGVKIIKLSSDADIGDIKDKFKISIEGERRFLAFKESDLEKYLRLKLADKKSEKFEFCGEPELVYNKVQPDFNLGALKLTIKFSFPTCYQLNEKKLLELLRGKNYSDVVKIIKDIEGIEEIKIKLWPWWIKRVPLNARRINIIVN